MKFRTVENPSNVVLRRERRSVSQADKFPLEDLNGNTVLRNRRITQENQIRGLEVTETRISQAEFQEYFDNYQEVD